MYDNIKEFGKGDPAWNAVKGLAGLSGAMMPAMLIANLTEAEARAIAAYITAENRKESNRALFRMAITPTSEGFKHTGKMVGGFTVKVMLIAKDLLEADKIRQEKKIEEIRNENAQEVKKLVPLLGGTAIKDSKAPKPVEKIPPIVDNIPKPVEALTSPKQAGEQKAVAQERPDAERDASVGTSPGRPCTADCGSMCCPDMAACTRCAGYGARPGSYSYCKSLGCWLNVGEGLLRWLEGRGQTLEQHIRWLENN